MRADVFLHKNCQLQSFLIICQQCEKHSEMGTVNKFTSCNCRFSDDDEDDDVDDGDDHLDEYAEAEGEGDEDDEPRDAKENPAAHTDAVVGILLSCNIL